MKGLEGKQIALAANRKADEIVALIQKHGGHPVHRPIQGQFQLERQTAYADVKELINQDFDWLIFTTGVGLKTLKDIAEENDMGDAFLNVLKQTKIAVRGSKTMTLLKELEIGVDVVSTDGTMEQLIQQLPPEPFQQKNVFIQLYGGSIPALNHWLSDQQAFVYESLPYRYIDPEAETLELLRREIMNHSVAAVAFTSSTQVKNLFKNNDYTTALADAFNNGVLAGAVGKVTAKELRRYGVKKQVEPEKPRMGAMIVSLSRSFEVEK